jgi:hypothetical protein
LIDWSVFNANFNNSKSKDRQYNVQKKKDKRTLTTQKAKYRALWIPLKSGGEVSCFKRVSSSCSWCANRRVLIQIFKEIFYLSTMIPHQWHVKNVCVCMLLTYTQIFGWYSDLNQMWLSRDNDFCFWMHEIIKIINI